MHFGFNPLVKYLVDIRDMGLEWTARRYYSLYAGEVAPFGPEGKEEDPQGQARVRVKVGILGVGVTAPSGDFDPTPIERPALPASIYAGKDHGMYFPPEVGNAVWVSFDHGDADHPRVHGSWWRNSDPNMESKGSEVPAEFRLDRNGEPIKGVPTRRGIKTKFGHGLIFSDEAAAPYVAIWSGETTTADTTTADFKAATVKQQITLSDTTAVPTAKDEMVDAGIYANTLEGLRLELDDTAKTVLLSGAPTQTGGVEANSIKLDDNTNKITVKTKGPMDQVHSIDLDGTTNKIIIKNKGPEGAANVVELDDTGKITIMTKGLQSIIIDDTTGQISVTGTGLINVMTPTSVNVTAGGAIGLTATGAMTLAAVGGIAMGSGAPPAPGAPGVAIESGQGAKIINFLGAVTETVLSMTQTVTTVFTQSALTIIQTAATSIVLTAPTISLLGGLVTIGPTPQKVMTASLLTWLADHTHTGNDGAPTPVEPAFKALLGDVTNSPFITLLFSAT